MWNFLNIFKNRQGHEPESKPTATGASDDYQKLQNVTENMNYEPGRGDIPNITEDMVYESQEDRNENLQEYYKQNSERSEE